MDIDDLKKSWHAIDEKLDGKEVVSEHRLSDLMQTYKTKATKNLKKVKTLNALSIGMGLISIPAAIILCFFLPYIVSDPAYIPKAIGGIAIFVAVMLLAIWWDAKTYRAINQIKVDEMPVIQVQKKISEFRMLIKYEVWMAGIFLFLSIGFSYWYFDIYTLSFIRQILFLGIGLSIAAIVLSLIYKKLIYGPLNEAQKNLKEISELEEE